MDKQNTEKKGEPITACKQYCLAAGATQGNIANTETVTSKSKRRHNNYQRDTKTIDL
jgi:hypothetical protein